MPAKIIFSTDQLMAMRSRYESGESFRDIAVSMGCAKNTIRAALIEFGVSPNVSRSIGVKMVGRPSPRLGKTHTLEARARMSAARKGTSGTRYGPHSLETLKKISDATKGRNVKYTQEQRKNIESLRQACKRFVRRILRATGKRKQIPSEVILGYSKHELSAHLGPKPSVDAHIDHYVPIAEFIRRGIADPAVICAMSNLRWMDASANRIKSAKVPDDADAVIASIFSDRLTATFDHGRVSYERGIA